MYKWTLANRTSISSQNRATTKCQCWKIKKATITTTFLWNNTSFSRSSSSQASTSSLLQEYLLRISHPWHFPVAYVFTFFYTWNLGPEWNQRMLLTLIVLTVLSYKSVQSLLLDYILSFHVCQRSLLKLCTVLELDIFKCKAYSRKYVHRHRNQLSSEKLFCILNQQH